MKQETLLATNNWWVLVAIGIFAFMSNLDASIVNIAMPIMSHQMNIPLSQMEWVVSLYLIFMCALLLFFGRLGDMYGKVRIFRIGTIIFIVGSILSALGFNFWFLLGARVVQAFGGALTLSNTYGIVTGTFDIKHRGRAMGFVGTFVALGSVAGPALGGLILANGAWNNIFWINVPIGLFAIIVGALVLPKQEPRPGGKIDWWGLTSWATFIIGLFGAIFIGQQTGFTAILPLTGFILAIISLSLFGYQEYHTSTPMMSLTIFRNRPFSLGVSAAILIFLSNFFSVVLMPFYLEDARGFGPGMAGLLLMIFPIVLVIVGPLGGWLADRLPPANVASSGLALIAVSQLGFVLTLTTTTPIWLYVLITALMAIGTGLFQSPNGDIVMSVVDRSELGIAGSINSLARNLGMVAGTAAATTTLFTTMSHVVGHRVTTYLPHQPEVFMTGLRVAFMVSFVLIIAALFTSLRLGNLLKHQTLH
ncbi:MFS transporter [Furfurilactobacillus siliginis]|uniref:MFS transporter n=1 Tax=Furfurilactobacillus siliginis TaxID=348151 RepID=A0A0R2L6Y2_9LACO|nr:MFS transporter [Furfurilactobacillus siliginis]KRN97136.1 transporter, major facilitator family protein [Furfurilactobacillus siliginis]GEK29502.1 MFS transporter [Furfurilactobacillus siliginis]